jgi:predicted methyltransferase MtxX (methanogen marker protein 4)
MDEEADRISTASADPMAAFNGLARQKRRRIGVGLMTHHQRSLESLEKIRELIDLVIVGPQKISGFDCIQSDDARVLVRLAKDGLVDGIFRGNFDAVALYDAIHDVLSFAGPMIQVAPFVVRGIKTIQEDLTRLVCILPVSPSNDGLLATKIRTIDANVAFFESMGVRPRIGILSAGKPSDILEGCANVDKTLTDAEFLVTWYTRRGYVAKHFNHQVEYAMIESDVIVYPDAIAGNHAIRVLAFFGPSSFLGSLVTNLPIAYIQTFEAFRDWVEVLTFFNAYLNRPKA